MLVRNFFTVGVATLASRLFGFVRDVLSAAMLGTGPVADAFIVAFRLPNLFRRLFAEGAFNSAFVPLFAKKVEVEGLEDARRFADDVLAGLFLTLVVVSALAMIFMPALVFVMAPGFVDGSDKFSDAVLFSRICFPYLLCMSLIALIGGVLNSVGRFAAAAWAPVILNLTLSCSLLLAGFLGFAGTREAGLILSWGVFVAGFLQLAALVLAVNRASMPMRLTRPKWTPDVARMVRLGVPGVVAGGVTQINLIVGTMIASTTTAAVSWLFYADRLYQLPLGLVGVAIGVVLLPELTRKLQSSAFDAGHTQNRALELSMILTLPAAVALALVPAEIVGGLFERGAFTASDTRAVAHALAAFAVGLPAFVLIKVFSPGYFAREDTKTPMRLAILSVAVNIALSLALFPFIGHVGIALATTISSWINAGQLWWGLKRRGHFEWDQLLTRRVRAALIASVVMGAALLGMAWGLPSLFASGTSTSLRLLAVVALTLTGMAVYGAVLLSLGGMDWALLKGSFKRKPGTKPSGTVGGGD